jgi:hypothetical protein
MVFRIWNHKENIFYTIVTIFLLERVRRGCNRIEARGRAENLTPVEIEKKQHTFTFGAALLYALPFLLPTVKYIYRTLAELSQHVPGLVVLNNIWAFAAILLVTEALLAIVLFNLLGIYVERMNGALGFFRKLGRSVLDGSKVAVQNVGADTASRVAAVVRTSRNGVASVSRRTLAIVGTSRRGLRGTAGKILSGGTGAFRSITSKLGATVARPSFARHRNRPQARPGGLR